MKLSPEQVISRYDHLKSDRATWETHWQECYDYMLPRKADVIVTHHPGEKKNTHLFDNTAMHSASVLASALHGMLTSPNVLWFGLSTGNKELDDRDPVRLWLQDTALRIFDILNNSNFNTEVHELYIDLVISGTGIFSVEEDPEEVIRFNTRPLGQCVVAENAFGQVDEVNRSYKFTASQIVEQWGLDNLPNKIKEHYEKKDSTKFEIIQAVYREDIERPLGRMPYTSQHVLRDFKHELSEGGFRSFPYMVPRFSKIAGEVYGRSPGMVALPDAKTINKMDETVLIGAEKAVDPPLQLPDDGFILPIMTVPGGLNYYRPGSQDRIEPVFNDSRVDFGFQAMGERRDRIRKAFFVDQLQLFQGTTQTATEVLQRTEENMRILAPLLGRLRHEFLRPLIARVMEIGQERDLFLRTPADLRGKTLDVNYSSLIARAQKLQEGQNILRMVETLAPFASAQPEVMDMINGDAAARIVSRIYDIPQEILRSRDEIEAIREARARAEAELNAQQAQQMQTENIKNIAPAITAAKR